MAKHDQRILKFLTQNAERTPTITDMMTRLNISISDITASLNSLMAQGLISKRTNGQGIECWFPITGSMPQIAPEPIQEAKFLSDSTPLPPFNPPSPASALTSSGVFPNLAPPKAPGLESAVFPAPPAALAVTPTSSSPPPPESAPMTIATGSTRSRVGWLPFLVGLVATWTTAVFVSGHFVRKDIAQSSKGLVEKSEMEAAAASWADFEASTRSKLQVLETQVKDLGGQLAALKTENDSLRALALSQGDAGKKRAAAYRMAPGRRRR